LAPLRPENQCQQPRSLSDSCSGIFLRSFRLHSAHYARETIAKICSLGAALATAPMIQTGSQYYEIPEW
jgi:hypothetical protein